MKKQTKKKTMGPVMTGMLMGVGIVIAQGLIALGAALVSALFLVLGV